MARESRRQPSDYLRGRRRRPARVPSLVGARPRQFASGCGHAAGACTLTVRRWSASLSGERDGARRPERAEMEREGFRAWEEIAALVLCGFSRTRQNPPKGGHYRDFFTRAQTLARRSQRSREGVARRMLVEREGFSRANSALRSLL